MMICDCRIISRAYFKTLGKFTGDVVFNLGDDLWRTVILIFDLLRGVAHTLLKRLATKLSPPLGHCYQEISQGVGIVIQVTALTLSDPMPFTIRRTRVFSVRTRLRLSQTGDF